MKISRWYIVCVCLLISFAANAETSAERAQKIIASAIDYMEKTPLYALASSNTKHLEIYSTRGSDGSFLQRNRLYDGKNLIADGIVRNKERFLFTRNMAILCKFQDKTTDFIFFSLTSIYQELRMLQTLAGNYQIKSNTVNAIPCHIITIKLRPNQEDSLKKAQRKTKENIRIPDKIQLTIGRDIPVILAIQPYDDAGNAIKGLKFEKIIPLQKIPSSDFFTIPSEYSVKIATDAKDIKNYLKPENGLWKRLGMFFHRLGEAVLNHLNWLGSFCFFLSLATVILAIFLKWKRTRGQNKI